MSFMEIIMHFMRKLTSQGRPGMMGAGGNLSTCQIIVQPRMMAEYEPFLKGLVHQIWGEILQVVMAPLVSLLLSIIVFKQPLKGAFIFLNAQHC